MKRVLIAAFISIASPAGFAAQSINGACNEIINGPSNRGSAMQVVVAKYRRLCVELATEKNLSVRDLRESECSSNNDLFGASPGSGYECLVARFGGFSKKSNSDLLKCEISYGKASVAVWDRKKDIFYVIDDNKGVDRVYTIDNSTIEIHVDKVDDITSIQWTVGRDTGFAEAFGGTRVTNSNGQIDFHIICDPVMGS